MTAGGGTRTVTAGLAPSILEFLKVSTRCLDVKYPSQIRVFGCLVPGKWSCLGEIVGPLGGGCSEASLEGQSPASVPV